jgi:hypothetical protein
MSESSTRRSSFQGSLSLRLLFRTPLMERWLLKRLKKWTPGARRCPRVAYWPTNNNKWRWRGVTALTMKSGTVCMASDAVKPLACTMAKWWCSPRKGLTWWLTYPGLNPSTNCSSLTKENGCKSSTGLSRSLTVKWKDLLTLLTKRISVRIRWRHRWKKRFLML